MHIEMRNAEAIAPERIPDFLRASAPMEFGGGSRGEVYAWVESMLVAWEYHRQSRSRKGAMRAYLSKVTGKSRAQVTRLIRQHRSEGVVRQQPSRRRCFPTVYTAADVQLLVEVDLAHGRLSGPATCRILRREVEEFGKLEFERLAKLSVPHLYNLRRRPSYRKQAGQLEATRPAKINIGERRRPEPNGEPGWLRVDTVHQGKWDGSNGVYHINAVDEVTQWQVVGCVPAISERHLLPVLEAILHQFPFRIRGVHADNGSEFVNHTVARLLEKLLVEFTRSRPNRSSDNALVEGKNGAVVRKHIGYGHIPAEHAQQVHRFYTAFLNPYLNFHRPCGFATVIVNRRGRQRRLYKAEDYRTPYEKLKSLPNASERLKAGICFEQLDRFAAAMSDTEAAQKMRQAKIELLRRCKSESEVPPTF
jgi:transposase InsO family protein